jgi:hypothetical protein
MERDTSGRERETTGEDAGGDRSTGAGDAHGVDTTPRDGGGASHDRILTQAPANVK